MFNKTRTISCGRVTTVALSIWLMAVLFCFSARGDIVLQNDSIATPTGGTPLPNFLQNEQAASWFTAPSNGNIVGVQVLWNSVGGFNPPQTELAIHVYGAGTFPTPGPLMASVTLPTLSEGVVNQFNFLNPPTNTIAMNVPVTSGQNFAVAIEFLNTSSGFPNASSIVHDANGCTASTNSIFTIPGGWSDACAAGVTGNFGIRAIHRVPEPATTILFAIATLACVTRRRR